MEEVRKIESVQVDQKCPLCNNGWMRPTGIIVGVPALYEHKCTQCDYKQSYPIRYPYIVG
jgi:hypothetical protein